MKKSALVFGIVLMLGLAGSSFGLSGVSSSNRAVIEVTKVTVEQARKAALKRVEGTVEDEYTYEDDDGEVDTYIFIIKNKAGKTFEVQIGAEKGDVVSVEEYTEEGEDSDNEPPPAFVRAF